ncbi:glycoside hydrolase family 97 protein [Sphingomonas sp. ac-8]|uniref:glycoside hydrolase family 97 protein n=1 Tax=Sphingomonas sp. ac-8 TaxID=3242977 RepID=UPI003A81094E
MATQHLSRASLRPIGSAAALLLAALPLSSAGAREPAPPAIASPDGGVVLTLGTNAQGQPTYRVARRGRTILAPSLLGLEFERYAKLSDGLRITAVDRSTGTDRYTLPAGKVSSVAERYNQIVVHFAEPAGQQRRLDLVVRAYDTGVAMRYAIPQQASLPSVRLVNELTQFAFPADYGCTGLNLGSFGTSHEGEYDPVRAGMVRPHNLYELPFVCRTGDDGPSFAIAEAAVENWPAMYLTGTETGALGVAAKLTRRPDDPDIAVKADVGSGLVSPWRVVMIADEPGKLIENTLLTSLNPTARGDFSWVKPGKTAWDWWSGPVLSSVRSPGTNDETEKAYIDFAASLKLPYMMVDDNWYVASGNGPFLNEGADPTRPIPELNLPELVAYGRERGVGLIVWVHWQLLDRDMDRILAQIERWGIKGIKVDFMNRDDQEMIGFYHRLADATARHHLLLDLHGATHPWGMTRTWPNFLTQEGVLGAEYNKWTRRITARHNVTLAYTRMLAGPLDYTPGGYRNRTPETFRIQAVAPEVQTTRGQALAMYVVYESPLQSVADSPDAYRDQPGLEFLSAVPASWDETRFLAGTLGSYVAVARRKGRTWYVGAMTDAARTVTLPLAFLGKGRFALRSWQDGAAPTELVDQRGTVTAADPLTLTLAASGGAVAILEPIR